MHILALKVTLSTFVGVNTLEMHRGDHSTKDVSIYLQVLHGLPREDYFIRLPNGSTGLTIEKAIKLADHALDKSHLAFANALSG